MKKNKAMRAAGVLMIATLLSTNIVSGTYAKYVTSGSASDSARVAKFGVTIAANGTLFSENYLAAPANTPTEDETGITVKSSDDDKNLVAPGTKNDTGMTFSITGTPEVDVIVDITVSDPSDIFLNAGTYPDMTTALEGDQFETDKVYYPVKYTLKKGETPVAEGTLKEIANELNELEDLNNKVYSAGTDLANVLGTYNLTWAWDFDDAGNGTNDKADTLLGDLAAGTVTEADVDADNYGLGTELAFTITVTQVD